MSLNNRVLCIPQPMTAEQIAERRIKQEKYENYLATPEGQRELKERLDNAAREVQAELGLTGNPQYDDFVRRAKHNEWWYGVKDRQFTI